MSVMQNTITPYQTGFEICGAVFCVVCILMSTFFKGFDKGKTVYLRLILGSAALMAFSEAIAISFDGGVSFFSYIAVRAGNFFVFLMVYVMTALGLLFFKSLILNRESDEKNGKSIENDMFYAAYIGVGICGFVGLLLVVSQFREIFYFIDGSNHFQKLQSAFLQQTIPCMVLICAFLYTLRYFKFLDSPEKRSVLSALVLSIVGFVLVSLPESIFGFRMAGGVFAEIVAIILFAGFISASGQRAVKREQVIAQKDMAINRQRIEIMQNQIRPHFIFNSLLAIKQLCLEEPREAADALQHFSGFLRANLEAMTDEKPVPIEKEIDCIKEYVALELADPANRFQVYYDIAFKDFKVPLLSVEPMVENAIRHGIATKKSGGIVRISTFREGNLGVVTVEDNGLGFGSETVQQAEHRSIGIRNSKERLTLMCRGELSIVNTGSGTIVRISVPLETEEEGDDRNEGSRK